MLNPTSENLHGKLLICLDPSWFIGTGHNRMQVNYYYIIYYYAFVSKNISLSDSGLLGLCK